MTEGAASFSSFLCQPGRKLDFQWGTGRTLQLAEVGARANDEQTAEGSFGVAHW